MIASPGFSLTLLEETPIEEDTQAKKAAMSPAETLFISKTLLVICFNAVVSASGPAAQAIMFAACKELRSLISRRRISPSVG